MPNHAKPLPRRILPIVTLLVVFGAVLLSAHGPVDRITWLLEASPVFLLLAVFAYLHRRFPLTDMAYLLLGLGGIAMTVGAHYGFARVPMGDWLQETFDLDRNPYDRLGHVLQGIVPAILAREWLVRHRSVDGKRLLPFLCICIAMTVSAVYELAEWLAAIALGQSAEEFLGMQGDEWDTQADMACALLGGLLAMTVLVPFHDRSLKRIAVHTRVEQGVSPGNAALSRRPATDSQQGRRTFQR